MVGVVRGRHASDLMTSTDTGPPAGFARVGTSSAYALAGACTLARRRPTSSVGTDHLLVSLALRMPGLREALGSGLRDLRRALGKEQHGPEPATRASGSMADLDLEVDGALREALWLVFVSGAHGAVAVGSPVPQVSPGIREALRRSLVDSAAQGVHWSGSVYLLDAVLADPQERAHRLLRRCHIEPQLVLAGAHHATATPVEDRPRTPMIDMLSTYDAISPPDRSPTVHLISRLWGAYIARRSRVTPILHALEMEAIRQAVRLDHLQVTTAHLLLAVLSLDEQLTAAQVRLPNELVEDNAGGEILAAHGVTHHAALQHLAQQPVTDPPVPSVPPRHQRLRRTLPHDSMWTSEARDAGTSARATTDGLALCGSTQLLIAALTNLDASAAQLLRRMGPDPAAIVAEAQHRTDTKRRAG
jgi:hypothetical protein